MKPPAAALSLALLGCGGGESTSAGRELADFVPEDGLHLELAPPGEPDATPLLLRVDAGWAMRIGTTWEDGEEVGSWPVRTDDGLTVGTTLLLPEHIAAGTSEGGTTVESTEAFTAWYGTFEDAVTVSVEEGRFSGTWAFGAGLGPVFATVDGAEWELVYYE